MKTKTKMIIALSLAGVITLGAVIALVVVIASFNATAGSGLSVSYVAKNVEAEVSMGYVVSETNTYDPKSLTYTTVQAGSNDKLTFSSSDTSETVSKNFDAIDEIELTKNGYVYLKYTFKHTGTATNSGNYLNITLNNTFSTLNNIEIEYMLNNSEWLAGINGLTVTRDGDNECTLFMRIFVDLKTQNALLDGSFIWSMTTSDTVYHANLISYVPYTIADFSYMVSGDRFTYDYATEENLAYINDTSQCEVYYSHSMSADGSGPITAYILVTPGANQPSEDTYLGTYVLSESEIFATDIGGVMGYGCPKFNNFNTSNIKYMDSEFTESNNVGDFDLRSFDVSNVVDMSNMFGWNTSVSSVNMAGWDTSKVKTMDDMFYECSAIESIDMTGWDTSNVTDMNDMFNYCPVLKTVYVDSSWTTENVTNSTDMFVDCYVLTGGNGTVYSSANPSDKTYARIDTAETHGYFTLKTA